MRIDVNGSGLWFDVDGLGLVPDGPRLRSRPTVVLVHGGPGGFDHSYFQPHFSRLTAHAQVVYLDLPGHGRSDGGRPDEWTFERCADAVRAFCDALGIDKPVVLGHSMGGPIVLHYGARHPGHARGLIVQSGFARWDYDRMVEGFRRAGGDRIAELAGRSYTGQQVSEAEDDAVFAAFGPRVPDAEELDRIRRHPEVNAPGMALLTGLDMLDDLARVTAPTLVCVGSLDPVTPVGASEEIVAALAPGCGRLAVIDGLGHFPWLDDPERYWPVITDFVDTLAGNGDTSFAGRGGV